MDLDAWSACLRVLADPTRVRLLALLEREELTVAELSAVTRLAQPRVSTHLAKLKEADLVRDRRAGVSAYYRFNADHLEPGEQRLWETLRDATDDPLLRQDAERLPAVLATRAADQNWADSVAGDMERHYSPGRTWEALARSALSLLSPGDVLDIASGDGVLAELLAPLSKRYVCIDSSAKVVAAASERLQKLDHVEVIEGDMQALPFDKPQFLGLAEKMHRANAVVAISSYGRSQLWRWAAATDWARPMVTGEAMPGNSTRLRIGSRIRASAGNGLSSMASVNNSAFNL